jgi:hypothetical protein
MDNVNIENVGGMRGVASEATLQSLVEAIRKTGGNAAANSVQNLHTRSIKDNTKAEKDNSVATGKTTVNLKEFGKELITGGDRVSDFADALFGSSSKIARFSGYVDGIIDDFRSLSSVGASFNNSIFDMIGSSSSAAMTMDGFSQLIRNNSTELAYFAGTVTKGAKFLGEFSRDVRLGIGNDFLAMGMTMQDVNEGLVDFMSLETMRGRTGLRNDSATQDSAANYIRQLDLLSKLTGKQKDALAQDMAAMQADTKMRNVFNKIEQTQGKAAAQQAEQIYTLQKNSLPGFNEALMDMSDGIAQSPMARALESMAPGITAFQQRLAQGGMSLEEYQDGMSQFGTAINRYSSSLGGAQLDVYRTVGGFVGNIAELSDSAYQFNQIANLDPAAAAAEQKRRDRITSTLGKFEQAIIATRKAVFDAFINSAFADKLGELGSTLMDMFKEGSASNPFEQAGSGIKRFFDSVFGANGWLTVPLTWLANFVQTGGLGRAFNWLADKAKSIGNFFKGLKESYDSGTLAEDLEEKFLSAMQAAASGISEFWKSSAMKPVAEKFFEDIKERFFNLVDKISSEFSKQMLNLKLFGYQFLESESRGAFGSKGVLDTEQEILRTKVNTADGIDSDERTLMTDRINELQGRQENASGMSQIGMRASGAWGLITQQIKDLENAIANATPFSQGTNGFQNFGKQSLAMLHGNEAVVPRNTPEGDMLAAFHKSQSTNANANTSSQSSGNQTEMNKKLDQLNSTMQTVAALLSESVTVQRKMNRGIGGMGTDLMRG